MENIVIIGSGPAGYTAAIYCSRANLNPIIVAGGLPGGLLTQTTEIENFPGFPDGITGFELMMHMQAQAEKFGTKIMYNSVTKVNSNSDQTHEVVLDSGEVLKSKAVILATGASPRWLGIPAEERLANKGVSACATCDGAFYRDVPVAVIGGGDSAVEEATFLTKFASKVYLIHRRDKLRASKIMADRAINSDKIEMVWDSVVEDILGENEVEAVKVKNVKTGEVKDIECKAYFAALGHIPTTSIFENVDKDEQGYLDLKGKSSHTNIEGLFGAGDCADNSYRQAITAAGMGCKAAMDAEKYLEGLA